jgi:hypothetical protein
MALSEFETRRCEKLAAEFIERRRPPPHLRDKVDFGYLVAGQAVEIFTVRPRWDDESQIVRSAIAKARFERTTGTWRVFWQRADMKWHAYQPCPRVKTLEEFFAVVDEDAHCCFFG